MDASRRNFLVVGGRILVMTGLAAAALEHVLADTPEKADSYTTADHWWAMIDRHREVHRLRELRARVQGREQRADEPYYFRTWVERYHVDARDLEHPIVDSPGRRHRRISREASRTDGRRRSSCPRSATTAWTRPASQVCPVGATFRAAMAWCSSTRATASVAAIACRRARMAAATSTRARRRRTSARCATTA